MFPPLSSRTDYLNMLTVMPVANSDHIARLPEEKREHSVLAEFGVLTLLWLTVAAVFWLQNAIFDGWPWSTALRVAILDWGPWIVLSPFVLWLNRTARIDRSTWRWAYRSIWWRV